MHSLASLCYGISCSEAKIGRPPSDLYIMERPNLASQEEENFMMLYKTSILLNLNMDLYSR